MKKNVGGHMKNVGLLLVVLMLMCTALQASGQQFPLAPGNIWRYRTFTAGSPATTAYVNISVTGDTLMSDGHRYAVLDRFDMLGGRFLRCDSAAVTYWDHTQDTAQQVLRFTASRGQSDTIRWHGYMFARSEGVFRAVILDDSATVHTTYFDGLIMGRLWFAERFGYFRYEFYGDGVMDQIWELMSCRINGVERVTPEAVSGDPPLPAVVRLDQNFPNPFNPTTTIRYVLPSAVHVQLIVYNTLGEPVAVLHDGEQYAGVYTCEFHAMGLPSGVYFYRLRAGSHANAKACIVLK